MAIRQATIDDIEAIIMLCYEMHQDSNFKGLQFNFDKTAYFLHEFIKNDAYIRIAEHNGNIVGGMLGEAIKPWYTDDIVAYDYGLFIKKDNRGSYFAITLIKDFTQWAKDKGAKQIRPGVSSGHLMADKLYKHCGYEITGSNFIIEV